MRTTYARQSAPSRGTRSWWGKAWQRAVEEAAYSDTELKSGRTRARRGDVGAIGVGSGSILAAVRDGDDAWTVEVVVPVLEESARTALVEAVAAESGRIAELLDGNLPHDLLEHAEEVGVELLPYGGELVATCTCSHYIDPCPHAVAVLVQVGWLVDAEPLVLFAVRGLEREDLLSSLHARTTAAPGDRVGDRVGDLADDVEIVVDAALQAQALLEAWGGDLDQPPPSASSRSSS